MSDSAVESLGTSLRTEFDDNAKLRVVYEERWARDLRQYLGEYDPEIAEMLARDNRSKTYLRKTKTKVDSIKARLIDLLFPAKGERNWDIGPSTTPEVHPEVLRVALLMEQYRQGLNSLYPDQVRQLTLELASDAANQMGEEMEGQLGEGPGRDSYRSICERVVFQGVLYGAGVLKGPLVERRKREKFRYSSEAGWALGSDEGDYWPFREFVSIWDIYPDLTATDPSGLRFVWQTHLKSRKDLLELADWPNFRADVIRKYIDDNPDGDAELLRHETEVRNTGENRAAGTAPKLTGRYRLRERWGFLSGDQLAEAGIEVEDKSGAYPACVWLLGDRVVKAVLAPIEGVDIPYHFFFYSEDETGFFPEGVASIMRHPQAAFNAAVRMALDNAAICSGPQIAINMSALHESEDPDDIYPFKSWKFKGVEDLRTAFMAFNIDSNINDLITVAKLMADWSDEQTTPRFMSGEGATRGAAETASGLSMLMSAANIVLKGLVAQFDNNITRPFITNLYYWNMRFNPRDEIKGDFVIKAIGSSALIARELQAERVQRVIAITSEPRFSYRVKDEELLEEAFKLMDMNPSVLRSEEEAEQFRKNQMVEAAQAQAQAMVQAILSEAEKRGIPIQQALGGMLAEQMQQLGLPQQGGMAA